MTLLNREVLTIQNPALGGLLLWRAALGFFDVSSGSAPLPLLFLVPPIMFHKETFEHVIGTNRNSGLRAFAEKLSRPSAEKRDLLLAIQNRALTMRTLTLRSLRVAVARNLLLVDPATAAALPLNRRAPIDTLPESIRELARGAERFGSWCGRITLSEVAITLSVSF